jgi:hypothetical protein
MYVHQIKLTRPQLTNLQQKKEQSSVNDQQYYDDNNYCKALTGIGWMIVYYESV